MRRVARAALTGLIGGALVAGAAACSSAPRPGDGQQDEGETAVYATADGEAIYVDPTAPLPAVVLDDIAFVNQEVVDALPAASDEEVPGATDASRQAVVRIAHNAAWAADASGRQVIVVYRVWGAPDVAGTPGPSQWLWGATRGSSQTLVPDKAARVAEVEAYVAGQADADTYEVVVLD